MERHDDYERRQEDAAAEEAAHIGGNPGRDPRAGDPDRFDGRSGAAFRAVEEAGGGEAEGFEESEALLEERATDMQQPSPFVDREGIVETEEGYRVSDDEYGEADSAVHED